MLKTEVEIEVWAPENNKPKKKRKKGSSRKKHKTKVSKKELPTILEYIKCLSAERAKDFHTWIEVGWCLHNIHNKDETLLKQWIKWSKKAPQYAESCETDCREKWDEMADEGFGIGSLKLWAKEDNPKKYIPDKDKIKKYHIDNISLLWEKEIISCNTIKNFEWINLLDNEYDEKK
jgi:hypothetical protein